MLKRYEKLLFHQLTTRVLWKQERIEACSGGWQ